MRFSRWSFRISGAWVTLVGCGSASSAPPTVVTPHAVTCKLHRDECKTRASVNGKTTCTEYFTNVSFSATACTGSSNYGDVVAECKKEYCTDTDGTPFPNCNVDTVTTPFGGHEVGICFPDTDAKYKAFVTYQRRFRTCTASDGLACALSSNTVFDPAPESATRSECVDASGTYGIRYVLPPAATTFDGIAPASVVDGSVNIVGFTRNDAVNCGPSHFELPPDDDTAASETLTFALPAGKLGTVVGAGTSVDLLATQGFATVSYDCAYETCKYRLDALVANLADVSVLGSSLRGASVRTTRTVPISYSGGHLKIATGDLELAVQAKWNGTPTTLAVENSSPWLADFGSQSLHLAGSIDVITPDSTGRALSATGSVDTTAPLATPQQTQCAGKSVAERLFGFEDRANWSSSEATLSLVTSPLTEGCGALGIAGQGYLNITGDNFATRSYTPKPALSVDLFIPGNQPNPSYVGALQVYLSCPSAAYSNQYVGQALLTGLPQNQFSTLRIPLPFTAQQILSRDLVDCSFKFGLNVNPTNRTWILDNLRFSN